jgi:UDP-glucose 4-epimerase
VTLLVTGGNGFVLSNLVRYWLQSDEVATCIILDTAGCDAWAQYWFASVRDRIDFVQADVTDVGSWARSISGRDVTHVVHGAAITPSADQEAPRAREILDVNIMGTVAVLEVIRSELPNLQRLIYVSSGSAYGDDPRVGGGRRVDEDVLVAPADLYAVSKYASERVVERMRTLCGLDAASVRLSSVYGPMDRPTATRSMASLPLRLANLALTGRRIAVSGLNGGGDWIHATDVALALTYLLRSPALRHSLYNIGYGEFVTLQELLDIVSDLVPGFGYHVVRASDADIACDPTRRFAGWGAYDISRLGEEFGWKPARIRDRLESYLTWLRAGGSKVENEL